MKRWSLASRLVAGIVALLAVLAVAIGGVTVAATRGQALDRLDGILRAASRSTEVLVRGDGTIGLSPGAVVDYIPGQGSGALVAIMSGGEVLQSGYIGPDFSTHSLSDAQLDLLAGVAADGTPRTVELGSAGLYRVVATPVEGVDLTVINGLSLAEANAATASLIQTIAGVSLAAIAVALLLGAGVVRVALRPLTRVVDTATRVSELPLETGAVSMPDRVPVDAPDTEVGRVGTALNRLLGKVETSLEARYASEQKVRRFVADASHELRTPLASIRGYAELARRPARLPADTARSLERIESESVRMSTLVEEMMLLARLDAGRELRRDEVGLGGLLVEAVSDAHAAGPDHEWDLELPDDDLEVTGDRDRLAQALGNLLANARTHTPAGTHVVASLARVGDRARVTIADDGPGIPAATLPTVFERFARGDDARSRITGSTGLGLAIVAAIVEAHGGTVGVESVPGATRFTVELPVATPADPPD